MSSTVRQKLVFIFILVCSIALATAKPASTSNAPAAAVPTVTAGCVVQIPTIGIYTWQPTLEGAKPSWYTTPSVSKNNKGTHIDTVTVTTGATERDGTWTALTTITTVYVSLHETKLPAELTKSPAVLFQRHSPIYRTNINGLQQAEHIMVRRTR